MKRQRVKFLWALYSENKTYKLKKSFGATKCQNMRWENILAHARLWRESTQIEYSSQKIAQQV